MDLAGDDLGRRDSFVGAGRFDSEDDIFITDNFHKVSPVAELPGPSPRWRNTQKTGTQSGIYGLITPGSGKGPHSFDKAVSSYAVSPTGLATSHAASFVSPMTPTSIKTLEEVSPLALTHTSPISHPQFSTPGTNEVWITNAPAFASGSHPGIRFIPAHASEPRVQAQKGKGAERRYHTDPEAGGKRAPECGCEECEAQGRGVVCAEMAYTYLLMRGAARGGDVFGGLVGFFRGEGRGDVFPRCPQALSKLSERLERLAVPNGSADNGSRPAIDIPAFVRGLSGHSTVVAHAASDLDDGLAGRDTIEGAISPDAFLRIASGVSRAETEEKPLPPLPSDAERTPREKVEEWKDRVDGPGFRPQICEDTMDALTGSYAVSSNPSVMNEPPALGHLDRLRGTFGTLFMRMQPKLGKRLDRVRLGLANDTNSSLSVFSEHDYTAAELDAALASPSATPINGILPSQLHHTLLKASDEATTLEALESTAHRAATETSARASHLRATLTRVTAAATYIAEHRSSARRAKIRRSAGRRLGELEYRRARAEDGLRGEEGRRERDLRGIVGLEAAVEREVGRAGMGCVEEVLGEAERLWDEAHGRAGG